MGGVTVHWGAAGLTCMRNGDYNGVSIEADLALPIACALPPPFLLWLVAYCTFSTPPSDIHEREVNIVLILEKCETKASCRQPCFASA